MPSPALRVALPRRALLIASALLALVPAALSPVAIAAAPQPAAVRALFARLDRAIPARDVTVLREVLADDVAITLHLTIPGQPARLTPTKAEYLAMVEAAWAEASDYRYARSNEQVTLRGEVAVVSADVRESLTLGGRRMETVSRETAIVAEVDGRLRITEIAVRSEDTAPSIIARAD